MLYMTTGEILRAAQHLSGTHNLTFEDFQVSINYINGIYREVYSMICDERDDYYISTFTSKERRVILPEDLLIIKSVGIRAPNGVITLLEKCPDNTMLPGTYAVENNILEYFGDMVGVDLIVRYCPSPKTLTFPSPNRPTDIPLTAVNIGMDDEYIWWENDGVKYMTEVSTGSMETVEELPVEPTEWEWHGYKMTVDINPDTNSLIVYADGEETDIFTRLDRNDDEIPLTAIHFDGAYAMCSYSDNRIYVHDGHSMNRWNIKEQTGKETLGQILALSTNDITGYGCLYRDMRGKTWLSSFLVDTILDYPTNTLFQYLQFKLAHLFSSLNGMDNMMLSQQAEETRLRMFKELRRNRGSHGRIRNTITTRRW